MNKHMSICYVPLMLFNVKRQPRSAFYLVATAAATVSQIRDDLKPGKWAFLMNWTVRSVRTWCAAL